MFCDEIIRERGLPGVLTYSQLRRVKKNVPTSRFVIKISHGALATFSMIFRMDRVIEESRLVGGLRIL